MSNRRRLERLLRTKLHSAGKQYEEAKRAYSDAQTAARSGLPTDEEGRARIVCRRGDVAIEVRRRTVRAQHLHQQFLPVHPQ